MTGTAPASVQLAGQQSAATLLHGVLAETISKFPGEFSAIKLPERVQDFRSSYPQWLPRFESLRLASTERLAIGSYLAMAAQQQLVWQNEQDSLPLKEALATPAAPFELEYRSPDAEPGWRPDIVYRGQRWEASRLSELAQLLVQRHVITPSAGDSLSWMSQQLDQETIRLADRKLVVFGAAAEMAPTQLWLEAGASVLWLDVVPPPASLLATGPVAGHLYWPSDNADVLTQPHKVLATILEFADGEPVDLCLYAYAPGQVREVRLTGTMNAIVNRLPPELIGSVTMLVSPTTPTALNANDLAAMQQRLADRPGWEAVLAGLGLLGRDGFAGTTGSAVTRTVVGIQGASYQAAQYFGKVLMAETWATRGVPGTGQHEPLRVSANTAAITRTRSLDHPVFAAAFGGAAAFGVETFTPRQSRRVNGLLAVADWLAPEKPEPGRVRVHGGIHTLPYPLESALRIAAGIGFARSPRLLKGLIR